MRQIPRLDQILIHPEIEPVFAELADALPDRFPAGLLSAEGVRQVCRSFPMRVIKAPRTKSQTKADSGHRMYFCISGLRTFQIAKVRMPPDTKIPVILEREPPPDLATQARQELLLSLVLFGMHGSRNAAPLEVLRCALPQAEVLSVFPGFGSARQMAQALGISRNALRAAAPKPHGAKESG